MRLSARRLGLALLLAIAMLVGGTTSGLASYEHLARSDVGLSLLVEDEIVQVFVNCQLVSAYTGTAGAPAPLDLGWLERGAIVTVQVRGRKLPGYYEVAFQHGSRTELIVGDGSYSNPVLLPAGRVALDRSFTADGRDLGDTGCQTDAPFPLAFAAAAARTPSHFNDHANVAFDLANALSPDLPPVLALIGASGLIAAVAVSRVRRASSSRRVAVRALAATAELVLVLLLALAALDYNAASHVCVLVGIVCLVAVCWWLVVPVAQQPRSDSRASRHLREPDIER
jgi:hypothetical protein